MALPFIIRVTEKTQWKFFPLPLSITYLNWNCDEMVELLRIKLYDTHIPSATYSTDIY